VRNKSLDRCGAARPLDARPVKGARERLWIMGVRGQSTAPEVPGEIAQGGPALEEPPRLRGRGG